LALENNGDFASIYWNVEPGSLHGCTGITLQVKGDDQLDSTAYRTVFSTVAGQWELITLPFANFCASFRGRTVPKVPVLLLEQIRQISSKAHLGESTQRGYPMKKLISTFTSVFLAGCGIFGIRTTKDPNYQVLNDYGQIQIRQYPALVAAETEVFADYKTGSSQAFQRLAGYIFGDNQKQQKISMTTPIIQKQQAETMAMTALVIQQKSGTAWLMAFVLPKNYSISTTSHPLDTSVSIKELPGKKVAVIQYSGSLSEQAIEEKSATLKSWLSNQNYKVMSPLHFDAYDPRWTLPFLRRNEIHIDIQ